MLAFILTLHFLTIPSGWEKKFPKHCESVTVVDPEGENILLASRNNIYQSTDAGTSWKKLFEVPLNYLVNDITYNTDSSIICGISNYVSEAIYRYDLKSNCLTKVLSDAAETHPIIATESDSIFFIVGKRGTFYRTQDFGKNWSKIGQYPIFKPTDRAGYYICSANSCVLNGHRRFIFGFVNPSRIIITDDTAKTFKTVTDSLRIPDYPLPQITVGKKPNEFYCCINDGTSTIFSYSVIHSNDYGSTWNLVRAPSSLWTIISDRRVDGHCLVGAFSTDKFPDMSKKIPEQHSSVYESFDSGEHWSEVGILPSKLIWNLTMNATSNKIYATAGDGLYVFTYPKRH